MNIGWTTRSVLDPVLVDRRGWAKVTSRRSKATLALKRVAALQEDPLIVLAEHRVIFNDYKLLVMVKENACKNDISPPSGPKDDVLQPGSDEQNGCQFQKSGALMREMPGVVCMTIYILFKKNPFVQDGSSCHVWGVLPNPSFSAKVFVVLQLPSEWGTKVFEQNSSQGSEIEVVRLQEASLITAILRAVVTRVKSACWCSRWREPAFALLQTRATCWPVYALCCR